MWLSIFYNIHKGGFRIVGGGFSLPLFIQRNDSLLTIWKSVKILLPLACSILLAIWEHGMHSNHRSPSPWSCIVISPTSLHVINRAISLNVFPICHWSHRISNLDRQFLHKVLQALHTFILVTFSLQHMVPLRIGSCFRHPTYQF